uniref:Uncharacterized protein n=1 Tax=Cacopsylla melanoneura TaxID=428564 RepID=A0A8D8VWN1_9HEMI
MGSERMEETSEEIGGKHETVNKTVNINNTAVIFNETTLVPRGGSRDNTIDHSSAHVTFCDEQEICDTTSDKTADKYNLKDVEENRESISNQNESGKTSNETSIVDDESRKQNSQTDEKNSNVDDIFETKFDKTSRSLQTDRDDEHLETEYMDVQPGCSHDKDVDMKEVELTPSERGENVDGNIDENCANVNEKERLDQSHVEKSNDNDENGIKPERNSSCENSKESKKDHEVDSVKADSASGAQDELREKEGNDNDIEESKERTMDCGANNRREKELRHEENPTSTFDGELIVKDNKEEDRKNPVTSKEKERIDDDVEEMEQDEGEPQPCLIGDLIDEINKNQTSLSKVPATMSSCVQNNMDPGKADQLKNILLLKNEPSFKLRKRVSNLGGKRKFGNVAGNKRREDLNIFLVKLIFGYSTSTNYNSRKCVEIVRNIIEMSRTREQEEMSRVAEEMEPSATILDQFKQDIYDLIRVAMF